MKRSPLKRTAGLKPSRMVRGISVDEYDELLYAVQVREENMCFFLEQIDHQCGGEPQACHLISQDVLNRKFPRGAVWRTVTVRDEDGSESARSLYVPAGRLEVFTAADDFVETKKILLDRRNVVFGCEVIHGRFDRRVHGATSFEFPRDELVPGFEGFVTEFGLKGEATTRFPFATADEIEHASQHKEIT